ncbi:uncharacterized protein LOC106662853 isoform X2 [Cimex lectularius]|uniref:Uncharacterized protein n=1 Tax=Cimex lectularius TaxID=79782 RepID=A0A8I6RFB2_CIMLE|nr:uncharacterized protein LOC106662853 isoform X2 [Cimex lectularius]
MAFMMPVVKNDYDIYKSARSRRSSECSNPCRSRKVSECSKSEGPSSLSTSPGSDFIGSPARSIPISVSRQSRSSRNSQCSLQSPIKSASNSPPKSNSTNSLNKFHNRLVDRLKRSLKCKDSSDGDARRAS